MINPGLTIVVRPGKYFCASFSASAFTRPYGIGLLRSQFAVSSVKTGASDVIGTRLRSEYTDRVETKTYCLTLFLSRSAVSVTQCGFVCTELSITASH